SQPSHPNILGRSISNESRRSTGAFCPLTSAVRPTPPFTRDLYRLGVPPAAPCRRQSCVSPASVLTICTFPNHRKGISQWHWHMFRKQQPEASGSQTSQTNILER